MRTGRSADRGDRPDMSSTAPLWTLTAAQLNQAFAARIATPSDAVESILARHDEVNPRINAVVTLDRDGARIAAAQSTARWRAGASKSALDGVPITIKDNIHVAGLRTTWGSRLFADHVPTRDETPVARLRDAGAIILGKTNVPEFTVQGITDNALFGATRNPWNPDLTPGGSSGGAVGAVAAGIGPLALCTDGGGSIRRPAGHTGLVGFKPSRGLVPRAHGLPAILHDFEVAGPIGRSLRDVKIMLDIIAGTESIAPEATSRPLRIAYIPTFSDAPVDPTIARSVAAAAKAFAEQGHHVERLDHFVLAEPIGAIWPTLSETGVAWLLDRYPDRDGDVGAGVAAMSERGRLHTARDYLNLLQTVADVEHEFIALFARFDVLLLPTAAAQPWPIGLSHPTMIDGRPVGPRGHAVFTAFANALGLPAISIPGDPADDGMPIGIQLCGACGADALVFRVAAILSSDIVADIQNIS
jgi:aspartyl-tRNA(Asn)/glutamyl-tRNA(Gln) amidotransferase subunit A